MSTSSKKIKSKTPKRPNLSKPRSTPSRSSLPPSRRMGPPPKPIGGVRQLPPRFPAINESAPSAVSQWRGPHMSFSKGRDANSVVVHMYQPLVTLTMSAVTFQGCRPAFTLFSASTGGGAFSNHQVATMGLSPSIIQGLSAASATTYASFAGVPDSIFTQIFSSAFSRYRAVSHMRLHYAPTRSTSDDDRFALAFSSDPNHPILGSRAYYTGIGGVPPNFTNIKISSDAMVFAGWCPWSAEFICDLDKEYYTFNNALYNAGTYTSATAPLPSSGNDRECYFGSLAIASDGSAGGVTGELYWEQSFEFTDFTPIINSVTSIGLRSLTTLLRAIDSHSVPRDDDSDLNESKDGKEAKFLPLSPEFFDPPTPPPSPLEEESYSSVPSSSVVTDVSTVKANSAPLDVKRMECSRPIGRPAPISLKK